MKIKKKFKITEFEKEENFLNEYMRQGYLLSHISNDVYYFSQTDQLESYYMIDFYFDKLSKKKMTEINKKGFIFITLNETELGYHYYFLKKDLVQLADHYLLDRYQVIAENKDRFEKYSIVIVVSSFTLFSYMYLKYQNPIYLITLSALLMLAGALANIYISTLKLMKRISEVLKKGA